MQTVKAIQGVVLYPNGEPIEGAKVAELTSDWKTEPRPTITDARGHFDIAPIKRGKVYYLQVTVPGAAGINPLRIPLKINRVWGKGSPRLHLQLA